MPATSREHLIQGDVARMLLGDFDVDGVTARQRLPDSYQRSSTHPAKPPVPALDLRDGVIKRLLCRTCNSTWAQDLEARAARHLHAFNMGDAALDPRLVTSWLAFMTIKVFAYHRSAWTNEGQPFGDCLSHVAHGDDLSQPGALFVARGVGPSGDWLFQSCITGDVTIGGKRLYSAFALRGLAWVLRIADPARIDAGVETRLTPATIGLRLVDVATGDSASFAALGLPGGRPFSATWHTGQT